MRRKRDEKGSVDRKIGKLEMRQQCKKKMTDGHKTQM